MSMNIKKVLLPAPRYIELNRIGMTDTVTYRYCIFGNGIVRRIRREYLGTTAAIGVASDNNPNGWQAIKVEMKK